MYIYTRGDLEPATVNAHGQGESAVIGIGISFLCVGSYIKVYPQLFELGF